MLKIDVYTDGSATIATKPGGYAFVLVVDGQQYSEGSGHMAMATNNDAELEAAIQGLAATLKITMGLLLQNQPEVTLVSDSQIILGWANGNIRFKQEHKMAKYEALRSLMKRLSAKTRWVEGHSGEQYNERCDKLANLARKSNEPVVKEVAKKLKPIVNKSGILVVSHKSDIKIVDLNKHEIYVYSESIDGPLEEFIASRLP